MRKEVILSAAKNPGESSRATSLAAFHSGLRRFASQISISQRYVTVTVTTWVATALIIAALAPPSLIKHGEPLAAAAILAFFSKLCHQRPDRVFYLFGVPAAVCIRCLGIYAGAVVGSLIRLNHKLALRCLGIALALNFLDVAAEAIGLHGNLPLMRLLIGAALGFAVGATLSAELPLTKSLAQPGTLPAPR